MWVSTYKNGLKSSAVTSHISMNYGLHYDGFVMAQSMLQKRKDVTQKSELNILVGTLTAYISWERTSGLNHTIALS